ncbi:hypothetical protein ACQPXT_02245 [Streptomyces sp. CA-100214]
MHGGQEQTRVLVLGRGARAFGQRRHGQTPSAQPPHDEHHDDHDHHRGRQAEQNVQRQGVAVPGASLGIGPAETRRR